MWDKNDCRLRKLRQLFEGYPRLVKKLSLDTKLEEGRRTIRIRKEVTEAVVNYLIDLLVRSEYFLDKTIRAVEAKNEKEGEYLENLLKRRLVYRKRENH